MMKDVCEIIQGRLFIQFIRDEIQVLDKVQMVVLFNLCSIGCLLITIVVSSQEPKKRQIRILTYYRNCKSHNKSLCIK